MITLFELLILIPIAVLTMLLVAELVTGTIFYRSFGHSQKKESTLADTKPTAILIPAHNEEDVIENTLLQLKGHIKPVDVVVVVADNCSDRTAEICRQHNVTVLERFNETDKGKGFALEHGRQWIVANLSVDNVVLFDADCQFLEGGYQTLIETCQSKQSVCQSCYLMKSREREAKTIVAELTWWLKNAIRPTGHKTLRIGTQIQGSGIAFPISLFKNISLASGSIVEDLELGLNLSMSGHSVYFCERSFVESYFPENEKGLEAQRTRWEHGHFAILKKIPGLVIKSLLRLDLKSVGLLLDAAIPPLFSFILLQLIALIAGAFCSWIFNSELLFRSMLVCVVATYASLLLVWLVHGHKIVGIKSILVVFRFFMSKFSIYTRFFTNKQQSWEKTTRDKE